MAANETTMSMIEDLEDAPVQDTTIRCARCAAPNARRRKFCAKCGAPLWVTCLRCGELSEAGEKYCGACGTDVAEASTSQAEHVEGHLRSAEQMRAACRFDEAVMLLVPITKQEQSLPAEGVARAKELLLQVVSEREQRRAAADEDYQRARQAMAAFDYDGAAAILENVPVAVHNDAVRKLLAEVGERQAQVAGLTEQLRQMVRQKRVFDLLPRIEQLLQLKPDHAYARQLAEQAHNCVTKLMEKRLAEHRYGEARELSERIAPALRTPQTQAICGRATELASFDFDLHHAPVIDATLVAVADRLAKLAPNDPALARLREKLHQRSRHPSTTSAEEPVPWARPPQPSALGVPVTWLTGFPRLVTAEELDRTDLHAYRGRFAVACGLALAGLRRAAVNLDLLATHHRGVLGRIGRLVHSRSVRSAWGLDLSASGLKAVRLAWNASLRQAVIESAVAVDHAKPLGQAVNEAEERKLMAETLKAFVDRSLPKAERTCVGLPGRMVLSKQFELPPVAADKLPGVVEFEVRREFPVPLDQLVWDYELFDEPADAAEPSGGPWRRALVVAAKNATTRHFLEVFRQAGIRADMLQTDFVALHNLILHEYFATSADLPAEAKTSGPANGDVRNAAAASPAAAVAAVDVGCDATNVVISSPDALWYRSCGVAGQTFTRALVKDFNLTVAQAEQLKRAPQSGEHLASVLESLSPGCDELVKELQSVLAAYAEAESLHPVQQVVGLGGGFALHGLFRCLRCGR
jgi:type IV pilus assembly protein PilM